MVKACMTELIVPPTRRVHLGENEVTPIAKRFLGTASTQDSKAAAQLAGPVWRSLALIDISCTFAELSSLDGCFLVSVCGPGSWQTLQT